MKHNPIFSITFYYYYYFIIFFFGEAELDFFREIKRESILEGNEAKSKPQVKVKKREG